MDGWKKTFRNQSAFWSTTKHYSWLRQRKEHTCDSCRTEESDFIKLEFSHIDCPKQNDTLVHHWLISYCYFRNMYEEHLTTCSPRRQYYCYHALACTESIGLQRYYFALNNQYEQIVFWWNQVLLFYVVNQWCI